MEPKEYGMKFSKEFESWIESMKENPGKTLTFDIEGRVADMIQEYFDFERKRAEKLEEAVELLENVQNLFPISSDMEIEVKIQKFLREHKGGN